MAPTLRQKLNIVAMTEVLLSGRSSIEWYNLKYGQAILSHLDLPLPSVLAEAYELDQVDPPEGQRTTARKYVYTPIGEIAAVISGDIGVSTSSEDVKDSIAFQLDHELYVPGDDDYDRLEAVLAAGIQDAPLERLDPNE